MEVAVAAHHGEPTAELRQLHRCAEGVADPATGLLHQRQQRGQLEQVGAGAEAEARKERRVGFMCPL